MTLQSYHDPATSRAIIQHSKSPNAQLILPDVLAIQTTEGDQIAGEWPGPVYEKWLAYVEHEWFPQKWTVVK